MKSIPSAGVVIASVFWDAKGILLIDYLEKGENHYWGVPGIPLRQIEDGDHKFVCCDAAFSNSPN